MCLSPDQRRSIEQKLVETYHQELVRHGVQAYERDQCWHDYQHASVSSMHRLIIAGGMLDFTSERGAALARVVLERTGSILADHGDVALATAE
jgi:hypothetical protein